MKEIYCMNCEKRLSDEDKVCPRCGSMKKEYKIKVGGEIELHRQIRGKAKKKSAKKSFHEFKSGDDFYKKTSKWNDRKMIINREKNYYEEVVTDKATGKIIHQCKEPLSKHKRHGNAKHKKGA